MRRMVIKRYARQRAQVGAAVTAYAQWRSESAAVRTAYRRWMGAGARGKALAAYAYNDALDREERAADRYARLIRRVGQIPETTLFHQLAEIDMAQRAR